MSLNTIINEITKQEQYRTLARATARPDLADDLYQEFLVALMTFPNLEEVYQKEWFPHLCQCIIKNLYHSPTSTFYKAYRTAAVKTRRIMPLELEIAEEPQTSPESKLDEVINLLEKMDWPNRGALKANIKKRKRGNNSRSLKVTIWAF